MLSTLAAQEKDEGAYKTSDLERNGNHWESPQLDMDVAFRQTIELFYTTAFDDLLTLSAQNPVVLEGKQYLTSNSCLNYDTDSRNAEKLPFWKKCARMCQNLFKVCL